VGESKVRSVIMATGEVIEELAVSTASTGSTASIVNAEEAAEAAEAGVHAEAEAESVPIAAER
jgi:hypothetical protein